MNNNEIKMLDENSELTTNTSNSPLELTPLSEKINLNTCRKVPLTELSSLGVLSSEAVKSIKPKEVEQLYKAVDKNGKSIMLNAYKKDGTMLANIRGASGRFSGTAGLVPVETPAIPPVDPVSLSIAVALYNISKQLDEIKDLQTDMFDFLKKDKQASQKGDYNYIQCLMNEYRLNFDNAMFVQTSSIKVEDIKQNAHHNIEFYENMITNLLKDKLVISNDVVHKLDTKLNEYFKDYQLAIYLFCMASFFTMVLNKNTKEEYLNSVLATIKQYSSRYKELYTISYNFLEKSLNESLQNKATDLFNSVLSKTKIQLPKDDMVKQLPKIAQNKTDVCYPFISTFELTRKMQSNDVNTYIDNKYLYLKI